MLFSTNNNKATSINQPQAIYTKINNPNWHTLFNTIQANGWTGKLLHIIFFYDHPINTDLILAVQQPLNNAKVIGILEGYTASTHTFADEDNDLKDDNGFVYESDSLMRCLTQNNLLNQQIQVFHKVNNDHPRRIVWSNDHVTQQIFYSSDYHFKECYYVIVNDTQPIDIQRYFNLNPSFLFVTNNC